MDLFHAWFKGRTLPGRVLISFWCDYNNKNLYFFYVLGFQMIFQFCSFWLLSKFGNIVIQLKCYLLGMLNGPEKIVRRIVFLFFLFSTKFKMADESHVTHKSLKCFTDLLQGSNFLIRFWCDSDITFLRGLHKKNW